MRKLFKGENYLRKYGMYIVYALCSRGWEWGILKPVKISWSNFKSQGLHIIRIKFWNASGSGSPPSLIPALCNIGILLHKQAKYVPLEIYVYSTLFLTQKSSIIFRWSSWTEVSGVRQARTQSTMVFQKRPATSQYCLSNSIKQSFMHYSTYF